LGEVVTGGSARPFSGTWRGLFYPGATGPGRIAHPPLEWKRDARMLKKTFGLSCWVTLALSCGACGGDAQATDHQADASVDVEDLARRELQSELSGRATRHRQRITELSAEKLELEERMATLNSEELVGPQADAWRDRLQDMRLEVTRLREELNAVLDEIAELSRSY